MIDMRYHDLPDWTETVRNELGHHIVACEEFYVHNNIVIYLERRKTVPDELLHPSYMYPSCNQISYSTDLGYITQRQVI